MYPGNYVCSLKIHLDEGKQESKGHNRLSSVCEVFK